MGFLQIAAAQKHYTTPEKSVVRALDDVTFEVRNNEFLTLLGPSGCGKTTLLKCIAGFEDLDGGNLFFEGKSLRAVPAHRRPFNTVFQNYALFPHMTIAQNVGYGLEVTGVKKAERGRLVCEMLERIGLEGYETRRPSQLSGGQQQRVALARSLVLRPRVLLLDEPLSALDRKMRESMQIELKKLQNAVGISFVFVTHDQEEALSMSDRVAVLSGGRLQQIGTPAEIYDRPANDFVANFIGASNMFDGKITARHQGFATVTTQDGLSLAAADDRSDLGTAVRLVLRPEHVRILPGAVAEGGNTIGGTVVNTVFVGAVVHVYVQTDQGRTITVHHPHDRGAAQSPVGSGDKVYLTYDAKSAHLMPVT